MTPIAKATLMIDDKVVTITFPRDILNVQINNVIDQSKSSDSDSYITKGTADLEVKAQPVISEHQLVIEKQPKGHSETVAVLAFALTENGHGEFTEEDMRKAYIRAHVKPPKVIGQAIRDAKKHFDYIESGSKSGTYKLSHHGDRTVRFDLPRSKDGK
jgi:hypothetical protein